MPILQIGQTHWIKGLRYCCPVYNALLDFSLKSSALPVEVKLNKRELEVYQLMQQGLSSAQMALALTIEKGTVAKYRQRINRKLKSRPSE
jgi:DNA-binding NarL/FixJ family response regulator